jgi:hypothetical protein
MSRQIDDENPVKGPRRLFPRVNLTFHELS